MKYGNSTEMYGFTVIREDVEGIHRIGTVRNTKKNQMVMKMAVLMNNDRVQEKSETCQATETTETSKMQQNGFI